MLDPAPAIARTILDGFDKHYRLFRETSAAARERFARADWAGVRAASRARIDMYDQRVEEGVAVVTAAFPEAATDESLWPRIKKTYISLLYDHLQPELAETFFNSVACRVLRRRYFHNDFIFVRPAVAAEHIEAEESTWRCYHPLKGRLAITLSRMVADLDLGLPLADPVACRRRLLAAVRRWFPPPRELHPNFQIQVLSSPFYRNEGAYVVGRVMNGNKQHPFVVALRHHPDGGLRVDALLHEREHLANLFSVAHAYFMVDMQVPSAWVAFLHEILPEKPKAELYTAVGLQKQGKTLFHRDLSRHLKHSADHFVVAPGTRGMVMLVFTMPSFPFVFKVIRDSFAPPKDTTPEGVKEKYRLVKMHDRVGRLADTLEYSDIALPLARFDPALLAEMWRLVPGTLEVDGDRLILRHVYIEQRMIPLDLYLRDAGAAGDAVRLRHGVREFGQALRDLAAANIFPGDLLPKNFGVTRYGRVVFYDYDEVAYLTDCVFRHIPRARNEDDEVAGEVWYNVGPNDVFPEEFTRFLFPPGPVRELFGELNGDLLEPAFWRRTQQGIRAGAQSPLFPYPAEVRLDS